MTNYWVTIICPFSIHTLILGHNRIFRQTGSGKTYTMEGIDDDRQRGIISRTISKIFEETCSLVEKVTLVKY
jgi:hypothetical protein